MEMGRLAVYGCARCSTEGCALGQPPSIGPNVEFSLVAEVSPSCPPPPEALQHLHHIPFATATQVLNWKWYGPCPCGREEV